jgi:hypothetical protein
VLFEDAAKDVATRYHSRPAHYYVRSKLSMDPVGRALHGLAEKEHFGLRVSTLCDGLVGFDWDAGKVTNANAAAAGFDDVRFEQGDVREVTIPRADTVLLIDILHYLTVPEQDVLLVRAAGAARRQVVVRDVDPDRGATSVLTQSWEWVTTTLGYNRGARVAPRSFAEITSVLEAEGLTVTRELCSAKGMSNVLLLARR